MAGRGPGGALRQVRLEGAHHETGSSRSDCPSGTERSAPATCSARCPATAAWPPSIRDPRAASNVHRDRPIEARGPHEGGRRVDVRVRRADREVGAVHAIAEHAVADGHGAVVPGHEPAAGFDVLDGAASVRPRRSPATSKTFFANSCSAYRPGDVRLILRSSGPSRVRDHQLHLELAVRRFGDAEAVRDGGDLGRELPGGTGRAGSGDGDRHEEQG